jgi:hypothetical protein
MAFDVSSLKPDVAPVNVMRRAARKKIAKRNATRRPCRGHRFILSKVSFLPSEAALRGSDVPYPFVLDDRFWPYPEVSACPLLGRVSGAKRTRFAQAENFRV